MKNLLSRLFGFRPGETTLALTLGFLLFGNSLALEVSNVVSVSGFLSEVGVNELLIVWIIDMLLVVASTALQSLIVDRFNRVMLLAAMSLIFAVFYVGLRLMFLLDIPGSVNYALLFLLTDQQWLFFPLIFWILANDVFDMAQAKRLFPVIASGGFLGQIAGLGIAAAAPAVLSSLNASTNELLVMNVIIYLAGAALILRVIDRHKIRQTAQQPQTIRETLTEGWGFVRDVLSFRYLMIAMLALSIGFTIVEFHFLVVSDEAISDADQFQTFYSLYNLAVIVIAIAVQSLLTGRILSRVNLRNMFLLYPITLLGSVTWMIVLPGLVSGIGGVTLPRLTKETVDESARKSFQALVPEERRGRVSMFMDSYLFAIGAIIGSVVTGIIVLIGQQMDGTPSLAYLAVAWFATVGGIWFTQKMRGEYDASLLNWRLKRRQRNAASVLDRLDF
jgi:ATP/ADP translocase